MGRIYEPEVAARAIVEIAQHPRREAFVGYSTVQTILGNKLVPGFLDHYLTKNGFKGQQTNEPKDPDSKNNLYEPIPGDHGAHGNFDAKAWDVSPQFWAASHKAIAWGGLVLLGFGLGILCARKIGSGKITNS
jgi:hypothetical protein